MDSNGSGVLAKAPGDFCRLRPDRGALQTDDARGESVPRLSVCILEIVCIKNVCVLADYLTAEG